MLMITINKELCRKCGTCVFSCPTSVYVQETGDSVPEPKNAGSCVACGHCVVVCPQSAITHSEFPVEKITATNRAILPSHESVLEFIRTRRSIRAFRDKPVERQLIEQIIDAAQAAPSSHNSQTTQYIVVEDKELLKNIVEATGQFYKNIVANFHNPIKRIILKRLLGKQVESVIEMLPSFEFLANEVLSGKDVVLHDPAVLLLFHADERKTLSDVNAQLALQNAALMIHALGLGSFWTGYLVAACTRDKAIPQMVNIPEHHKIYGGLAIGYPRFEYQKWMRRKNPEIAWM
jgi:nitroreductase/NAD-dependent dihydropyrimidine dehydrogenase PreA subunit